MSVWSAVGMSAGSNSSNADRQNASGRLSLPEDADNKAVPLRHRHPHLQSAFVSVFGCLDGRRFTKGRTATNVGVAQTAAVSLVVGMMTLGMPVAALAAGPATYGVDDGTHITLWSRAATQARADALVKAYNATHKNHIDATYVPTDDYQTKVGAAAAAGGLPDLFSADVVFMPNWTSAGLFTDMTDKIGFICR